MGLILSGEKKKVRFWLAEPRESTGQTEAAGRAGKGSDSHYENLRGSQVENGFSRSKGARVVSYRGKTVAPMKATGMLMTSP